MCVRGRGCGEVEKGDEGGERVDGVALDQLHRVDLLQRLCPRVLHAQVHLLQGYSACAMRVGSDAAT